MKCKMSTAIYYKTIPSKLGTQELHVSKYRCWENKSVEVERRTTENFFLKIKKSIGRGRSSNETIITVTNEGTSPLWDTVTKWETRQWCQNFFKPKMQINPSWVQIAVWAPWFSMCLMMATCVFMFHNMVGYFQCVHVLKCDS